MTGTCFFLFLLLLWSYPGYLLYLKLSRPLSTEPSPAHPSPTLSVIVPTCNESSIIADKIRDLERADYSSDIEFFFADASSDSTPAIIEERIASWKRKAAVVRCPEKGRRQQINSVLPRCSGEAVVITDADARFEDADTLKKIGMALGRETVFAAGAYVEPETDYGLDAAYWKMHNRLRLLESGLGHCSAFSGACYGFRRCLLKEIPEGVWADDIYIPLLAHFSGRHCLYLSGARVRELRAPRTRSEAVRVKARKAGDYMIELLRFLPKILSARGTWSIIYVTKLVQLFIVPLAIPVLLACCIAFFSQLSRQLPLYVLLGFLTCAAAVLTVQGNGSPERISFSKAAKIFIMTNTSLLLALILLVRRRGKGWYGQE